MHPFIRQVSGARQATRLAYIKHFIKWSATERGDLRQGLGSQVREEGGVGGTCKGSCPPDTTALGSGSQYPFSREQV